MEQISHPLAIAGGAAAILAAAAWIADRTRMRRRDLDRVGIVPWTPVFFFALSAAIILLGLAARVFLAD